MRQACAICLAWALLLAATLSAQDREPPARAVVLLAGPTEGDLVVLRLYEELGAAQLEVEVAPAGTDVPRLHALARRRRARATVLVGADPVEVQIWVGPGEVTAPVWRMEAQADPATLALATVEALRGYLVPLPDAASVDAAPDTAPEGVAGRQVVSGTATAVVARAAVGLVLSPGGVPLQLGAELGAEWWAFGRGYLEATVLLGLPGATLTDKKGQSSIWSGSLGFGAGYALVPTDRPLAILASAGLGALLVLHRDDQKRRARYALLPYLHVAARYRVANPVAVRVDTTVALALPEAELKLQAGQRAAFGQPMWTIALGLELSL